MVFELRLLSRKMEATRGKRDVEYSFLFVHPHGGQLAEIGQLLEGGSIRPVIDRGIHLLKRMKRLFTLECAEQRGEVVVQIR